MPRQGRIRIVGKRWEAREREIREGEMQEIEWRLRRDEAVIRATGDPMTVAFEPAIEDEQ